MRIDPQRLLVLRAVADAGGVGAAGRRRTLALKGNQDLHIELIAVYAGIITIGRHYRNQLGGLVNEVLTFQDGLVAVGHATHLQR